MYFIKRGDTLYDVAGQSFRDLLAGKLASQPSERATLSDWPITSRRFSRKCA